jgi:hypothetical protein
MIHNTTPRDIHEEMSVKLQQRYLHTMFIAALFTTAKL